MEQIISSSLSGISSENIFAKPNFSMYHPLIGTGEISKRDFSWVLTAHISRKKKT